jgi:two-component system OmpR family response regulator
MSEAERILVVDDDAEIRDLLHTYLGKNGYRVTTAADGKGMWAALDREHVDLIVLDLMLPGDDGLVLCRTLRAGSTLPVIMLTARGDEMDRILGLEMGADDYLPKPFNPRELLARIKGVLRRAHEMPAGPADGEVGRLRFSGWCLDTAARQLHSPQGVVVPLSHGEYRLLHVFLTHPNRVLSRDQLLALTQGREAEPFDRSIDVLVGRLRKRLGDTARDQQIIQTARSEGYVLTARVAVE